jgi:glutathione peroxidase
MLRSRGAPLLPTGGRNAGRADARRAQMKPTALTAFLVGAAFVIVNRIMGDADDVAGAAAPAPAVARAHSRPPPVGAAADPVAAAVLAGEDKTLPASFFDLPPVPLLGAGAGAGAAAHIDFGAWRGDPVLVFNSASLCGYTAANFAGLEALHRKHAPRLHVVGFPCAQFGNQEHADPAATAADAAAAGVTFPLAARVDVNGRDAHPVFSFLKAHSPGDGGDVGWNFEKWLIAGDGRVVARWGSAFDGAAIEREVVQVLGER